MIYENLKNYITEIPKAELHLHIEGSLEPELMFRIAGRNNIPLKYKSAEELRSAYRFNNLQEFLDIYYQGAQVLITKDDFYDLTWGYLQRVNKQNVRHVEIFFDPQTHTERGVEFDTVLNGIYDALTEGEEKFGISFKIIMSFLRHLSEEDAFKTLEQALPHKDKIIGAGLDSSEKGNPPSKFKNVFKKAKEEGFLTFAHAGEEGPPEYVREAIELFGVTRIDHGNRSLEDRDLVNYLAQNKIPMTLCPLSNYKLKVVEDLKKHPIKRMMDEGLFVTVNSDDPAYFGGYMNENYFAVYDALDLSIHDLYTLARNSFDASLLDEHRKLDLIKELNKITTKYD